jgi:hypothetical protein
MAEKMVSAVVVRGSYTTRDKDGNPVVKHVGDAAFDVPENHMTTFHTVLGDPAIVKAQAAQEAKAIAAKAAAEELFNRPAGAQKTAATSPAAVDEGDDTDSKSRRR